MAAKKRGVFQRFLELVLDEKSAKKTERDTQASLKRATDPSVVGRNLATFAKDAARITAQAAAAVLGYAVALTKLTERGGQVLGVQRAFERVVGDTDAAINKLRKATNGLISDYDLMVGFNRALTLGAVKNIDDFAEMSKVALDLSRAMGIDATKAMEDLSLGISRGSKLILDNLGLQVEGAVTVESAMAAARTAIENLGGASITTADFLTRVTTQFGNVRDEISKFLAQSGALRTAFFEVGNVLETIVLALQSKDRDTMVEAFKLTGSLAGTAFAASFMDAARGLFRTLSDIITPKFLEDKAQFIPVLGLFKSISDVAGEAADAGWSTVGALIAQGDALRRQLQTERELQGIRNPAGAPRGGGGGGGVGALTGLVTGRRTMGGLGAPGALSGVPVTLFDLTPQVDHWDALVEHYRSGMGEIESAGTTAALGIQSAFQDAFSALGEEGNAFGNFFEAIFRGAASSALSALAQLATAKVVENVARAFEQVAAASAAGAIGNVPGAALHAAAAKGFVLAAAKWAVVGGAAGAAAAAVGGGGSGAFRGSDAVGRRIDQLDRAGPEIIIYVDGMDPTNPRHQALVGKAAQQYQQRTGGTIQYRSRA